MASPVLSGVDGATFDENIVNATPAIIDGDVTLTDADGDWNGGQVVVSGLLAQDVISVQGSGPIYFDSSTGDIRYNGVIIGNGQAGAGSFIITFDSDATTAGVEAVIEHLTYANTSDTPTASRQLTINVIDAAGNDLNGATSFAQRTGAANPVDGLGIGIYARVAFVDLDGDGDLDMAIGRNGNGVVQMEYFENAGGTLTHRDPIDSPIANALASAAAPAFGDLDADGDLDLFLGNSDGSFYYYQNDGTSTAPNLVNQFQFSPMNNLPGVGMFSSPQMVDIDADGDLDLVSGAYDGQIRLYRNDGTAQVPVFVVASGSENPFNGIDVLFSSKPALADVDGDGDLDLVTGSELGALYYYENTGTAAAAVFVQRTGGANPFNGVDIDYGTPVFADLDGDGDQDLFVDGADGVLRYFENTTARPARITIGVTAQAEAIVGDASSQTLAGTADGELMQGLDGDDFLDAGAGDDTLEGGAGADYLRGGDGADTMRGGTGDDFYVVDNIADTTDETGGDGVDLVHSRINWTLADGFENLTLAAPGREINGTGNGLDNVITGNDFANQLRGEFGSDTLNGAGNNDSLWGGFGADILDGGQGNDILYGEGDTDALIGGAGHDVLDGGYGADYMVGGAGNDSYYVDDLLDETVEDPNAGTDIVFASVDWTLGDNFENLTMTGTNSVSGTGNAARNTITGNGEYNMLQGAGGVDTLDGAGGDDALYGGNDNDVLLGGDGADQLWGGQGSDRMTGGAGQDDFYFTIDDIRFSGLGLTPEKDTILDFEKGVDEIHLYLIDANLFVDGDQDFVLVSKFTKSAGQLVLKYAAASDTTTADMDIDGDGKADFRLTVNGDQTDHVGWYF